jgi:two-component SAPR family response regulator
MTENTRILVVDRDADFVNELTNFLLASGYRNILSVSNYNDALTVLKQNYFDIILMEIYAPDLKGLDYAREIKRLKPKTKTFLMIGLEYQELINRNVEGDLEFDCLMKSNITQDLLKHLKN